MNKSQSEIGFGQRSPSRDDPKDLSSLKASSTFDNRSELATMIIHDTSSEGNVRIEEEIDIQREILGTVFNVENSPEKKFESITLSQFPNDTIQEVSIEAENTKADILYEMDSNLKPGGSLAKRSKIVFETNFEQIPGDVLSLIYEFQEVEQDSSKIPDFAMGNKVIY